VAPISGIAQHY